MTRLAILALAATLTPALAETWTAPAGLFWSPGTVGSSVELRPTEKIGAVEELIFRNSRSDGQTRDFHSFTLGRHSVEIEIGTGDPDTIRVTPPDGFVAVPQEVTIPDGSDATIVIYPIDSVGM